MPCQPVRNLLGAGPGVLAPLDKGVREELECEGVTRRPAGFIGMTQEIFVKERDPPGAVVAGSGGVDAYVSCYLVLNLFDRCAPRQSYKFDRDMPSFFPPPALRQSSESVKKGPESCCECTI